jgi:hypothetical protein
VKEDQKFIIDRQNSSNNPTWGCLANALLLRISALVIFSSPLAWGRIDNTDQVGIILPFLQQRVSQDRIDAKNKRKTRTESTSVTYKALDDIMADA